MEKFISEHPAFVYFIFISLLGLIGYLAKWLIKLAIKDITNHKFELAEVKKDQKEITDNYITRFDRVDDRFGRIEMQANDHKLEIVNNLAEMKLDIQQVSDAIAMQAKTCALIQGHKNNK